MCRGVERETLRPPPTSDGISAAGGRNPVPCELCGSRASLYCAADDAYLCGKCDKWVHGANFLAQRHVRCLLCSTCQSHTQRYLLGASVEIVLPNISRNFQNHCDRDDDDDQNCSQLLKTPCLFL